LRPCDSFIEVVTDFPRFSAYNKAKILHGFGQVAE